MKIVLKTLIILLIAVAMLQYFDIRKYVLVETMDGKSKIEEIKK